MVDNARIRGIYGSGLAMMLLNQGFDIVDPSVEQSTRFKLVPKKNAPDLAIRDRNDRQGIIVNGAPDSLDNLTNILRDNLTDIIVRRGVTDGSRDFEFPSISKSELDVIRRKIAVTIHGHHFFKACGGEISSFVDMAERLLERGQPQQDVDRLFTRSVEPYLPFDGSVADVDHVKLDGRVLTLGQATILRNQDAEVLYRRTIRNSGVYDGLEIRKQAGDLAVTRTRPGTIYSETGYFSANGDFKGAYVNIGTPVELYPGKIRYVDLEVDLSVLRDGSVTVLDDRLLCRQAESETISQTLFKKVEEKVRELTNLYASDISELSGLYERGKSF